MRKRAKIFSAVLWTLSLAWIVFIFANSMKTGSESGQMSGSATELINGFLHTLSPSLSVSHLFVRKAAHFSEFAVLACLFCGALWTGFIVPIEERVSLKRLCIVLLALPCSVAVAATDETIQRFVAGRVGAITDVLIDSAGAATATLIFFLVIVLFGKRNKDKS
ncbi:MAG: VanZ family protein [Clostridia bacterium]|nr:VanZ family protein [Clostridia bacterium]